MSKKYSSKSTAIFLAVAFLVLVSFGLFSQNSNLFQGQLTIGQPGQVPNPGLILEIQNCSDECTSPSLIVNNLDPIESIEILVKNAFDGEVVYADYIPSFDSNSRYEISFDKDICGLYSFDPITSQYRLEERAVCESGTYDFITSAASQGAFFTEFSSFVLTE